MKTYDAAWRKVRAGGEGHQPMIADEKTWPKRLEEEGSISVEDWGFNEHEKLCAPAFIEGCENTWAWRPPSMHLGCPDDGEDITLAFGLGLSEGEFGPAWQFSLRDELGNCDWHAEDVAILVATLRKLAAFVEEKFRNNGPAPV